MADVFISYKAEDRERVRPLVAALEADGRSTWWDARIGGGARWRETIEEQLAAAACVIVAWSDSSVGPEGYFVRDEAARAQRRGAYLPVLIDAVEPPLGFGETQALSLVGWGGEGEDPRCRVVLAAVRAVLAGERPPARSRAPLRRPHRRALLAGGGAVALGAAGLGGWAWRHRSGAPMDEDGIVVLPFDNLSADPAQAFLASGITEEVRSALSGIGQLKVIGRVSANAMRGMAAGEIASKFGVAAILTGTVTRTPNLIRVGAQLVEAATGAQRWSDNYDRPPGDVIAIETAIARSIAGTLRARLGPGEGFVGTGNVQAHDLYLRALTLAAGGDDATVWRQAIDLLDAALALDPRYAKAWAFRAGVELRLSSSAADMATIHRQLASAERSARRAIAFAPAWFGGHVQLAAILAERLDIPGALDQARRVSALSPNGVTGPVTYFLATTGHRAESLAAADRLVARDPLNPHAWSTRAFVLYCARRYQEVLSAVQTTLAWAPKQTVLHFYAALTLINLGRAGEAIDHLSALPADTVYRLTGTAIAQHKLGDTRAADDALAQLANEFSDAVNYQFAQIHAQRGEPEKALAALEEAWRVRDNGLSMLPSDPLLDPVRAAPRFTALMTALRFRA